MDRAVSTLEAAVGGEHASLARRALGEISDTLRDVWGVYQPA